MNNWLLDLLVLRMLGLGLGDEGQRVWTENWSCWPHIDAHFDGRGHEEIRLLCLAYIGLHCGMRSEIGRRTVKRVLWRVDHFKLSS